MLDFKSAFNPSTPGAWPEMIKDMIAFANSGGGYIIIGATSAGTPASGDLSSMEGLDQADYVNQIGRFTSSGFGEIEIIFHDIDTHRYGVIRIGRVSVPIIFTQTGNYQDSTGRQKCAFIKGSLYFRHGSKSEPASQSDLDRSFRSLLKEMKQEFLKNVRKVVALPDDHTVIQIPKSVTVSTDPSAQAVRLTDDPSAPVLAARLASSRDRYHDLNEELTAAVRAWITDANTFVPESQLWRFYAARRQFAQNPDAVRCLLVSSLYRRSPPFYWAQCLERDALVELLNQAVSRDKYPGVNKATRIAFALGGAKGSGVLDRISRSSHLHSAKTVAQGSLKKLAKGKTVWNVAQLSQVERVTIGGIQHVFIRRDLQADPQRLEDSLDTLLKGLPHTVNLCLTLDALCYGARLRT